MFYVFEGIDGSGTTTQAKLLAEKLKGVYMHQPSDVSPIGRLIRAGLSTGDYNPRTMAYLFAADRSHCEDEIERFLAEGTPVVLDRYIQSTYAYQTIPKGGHTLDLPFLESLNTQFLQPVRTFWLDVPVETSLSRVEARSGTQDIYENREDLEHTYSVYAKIAQQGHMYRIDGTDSIESIHSKVLSLLPEVLRP